MKQKDIKLLWGRAAERCSFPDCGTKLTQDKNSASESFPLGEQAHIVGREINHTRGESNLTKEERDSYFNLILLCPTHHTLIDKNPQDYTVEKLHLYKDQHEYWVERTLSQSKDSTSTAQSVIYADLIDTAVEACQFDTWTSWATRAVSTNMNWDEDSQNRLFVFYNKIIGAIWPTTLVELECALKKLTYEIWQAINTFCQHCDPSKAKEGILVEDRFYKSRGWIEDHQLYQQLFEEYEAWQRKCQNHVVEATKAVNWFADVVRRDINPFFFATKGRFFVVMGPFGCGEFRSYFFEYTEPEKQAILRLCNEGWTISQQFTPDDT